MSDNLDDRIARLKKEFRELLDEPDMKIIDDFICTEQEDEAWHNSEPTFTKRIVTSIPTKQRRRVTQ